MVLMQDDSTKALMVNVIYYDAARFIFHIHLYMFNVYHSMIGFHIDYFLTLMSDLPSYDVLIKKQHHNPLCRITWRLCWIRLNDFLVLL